MTRLIQQEVGIEFKQTNRQPIEIDFTSPKVIQCSGELAQLENDDVVRSIGCGNTDKLSSFYNETESTKSAENHASTKSEKTLNNAGTLEQQKTEQ